MNRTIIWPSRVGLAFAAIGTSPPFRAGRNALECKPKTAGYFQQMAAFAIKAPSPAELVGITQSLTGSIGDPARGRVVMIDKE